MKICKNCGNIHNGEFGSGKFCSNKCLKSYSTKELKNKTKIINCCICNKEFEVLKRSRSVGVKCSDCKKEIRNCKFCNGEFMIKKKKHIFCSRICAQKNNYEIMNRSRKENFSSEKWSIFQKKLYREGKQRVGGGTTKWYEYKNIKVQGSYELRACKILDKMKELNLIKHWEYTSDRFQYIDVDGSERTYLLDFKVYSSDVHFYYVEVKGYATATDCLKWQAVRSQDITLVTWFNEELIKLENELNLI